MPIQYNSDGIKTQNFNEILDEREQALKPILGENFTISQNDPIGNMELADATSELSIQELIAYIFPNQLDANTATGIFLDVICEKNRIYRKQPQYTTLNLKIKGSQNTEFISGSITVSDNMSGIYYNLNENCIIGETGEVIAKFICEEYGENYPLETSKFEILTPSLGLTSVELDIENANIVLGRFMETDEELRRRRQMSVQQVSTTLAESIKASLYSLDGVKHVEHFENDTMNNKNGLPPKSFEYVVDGGDENEITDVIFTKKTLGSHAYGETVIQKTDSEGNVYNIGYTKADVVNIGITIKLEVHSSQTQAWINNIQTAIKEQFDKIQTIGDAIKDYNYMKILANYSEISDIEFIKFYDINDPLEMSEKMSIGARQIPKLETKNINIEVSRK